MNRDIRVFRYLNHNPGFQPRDAIMHWTGFPSPREHPVAAYVEFQNAVMRLNGRIHRLGYQIVRAGERNENYRLVVIERRAA